MKAGTHMKAVAIINEAITSLSVSAISSRSHAFQNHSLPE